MTSFRIDSDHFNSSVILRAVHSSSLTLATYHNLQGQEDLQKQISIFEGRQLDQASNKARKSNDESENDNTGDTNLRSHSDSLHSSCVNTG